MAERKQARRNAVIAAATELFGRHGYHATTVPMIVERSGASTGSFYLHFRNKEDVFAAVLESLNARLMEAVEAARARVSGPVRELEAAVCTLFLHLAARPREARILIVESSGLGEQLECVRRRILAGYAERVAEAFAAEPRVFAVRSVPVASRCLVGAVLEAIYAWLEMPPRRRPRAEAAAEEVVRFNMAAVTRRSA